MNINEYEEDIENLQACKDVCSKYNWQVESEMMLVSSLVKKDKENQELLRLQIKVNDRYFVNQEMLRLLNVAMKYLKDEKKEDEIYRNYIDKYEVLVKRFLKISKDSDFIDLSNKYFSKMDENNVNL